MCARDLLTRGSPDRAPLAPLPGKGDLVGCDIQRHLQDGSDVVVKSSSDVRALTYCDLKCLHIGGLVEVLKLYQDFQQDFSNDIRHDLTYNLREGYEADVSSVSRLDRANGRAFCHECQRNGRAAIMEN